MASRQIDEARVTHHNDHRPGEGGHVLSRMQASVRTRANHALEFAVQLANELRRPLVVGFALDAEYEDATPHT